MKFLRQLLSLFSVIVAGSVTMVALRTVYQAALPERPPYTEGQHRLVTTLAGDVQNWLVDTLPASQTRAVFANLDHDEFGFVGAPVRDAIWRTGRFDLAPRGLFERLRSRIGWTLPHWADGEASAYARAHHAAVAIEGSVTELSAAPQPSLRVHLQIVARATHEVIAARDFMLQRQTVAGALDRRLAGNIVPDGLRLLAWLALVVLLPLLVLPFAREVLLDGSNRLILLVLLLLVAVDVGSACVLYPGHLEGLKGAVLTLILFGLTFGLNARYLTWIKEQQA